MCIWISWGSDSVGLGWSLRLTLFLMTLRRCWSMDHHTWVASVRLVDPNVGCALGSHGELSKILMTKGRGGREGENFFLNTDAQAPPPPPKFWFNWSECGLGIEIVKFSPGGFSMHYGGDITASHLEEVDFSAGNGGCIFLLGPKLDWAKFFSLWRSGTWRNNPSNSLVLYRGHCAPKGTSVNV